MSDYSFSSSVILYLIQLGCIQILYLFPCSDQAEARRTKVKEARKRREERIAQKKADLIKAYREEDALKK